MAGRGLRLIARAGLHVLFVISVVLVVRGVLELRENPALTPYVERGEAEFRAAVDAAMARAATPQRIHTLIEGYLAETPRDWIALRAVEDVAAERGIPVDPALALRISAAWDEDSSMLAKATACGRCMFDVESCSISETLICNVPISFTPVGDVAGLAQEGLNAARGRPVDTLNLTLSAIGLGATAAIVVTEGSSLAVKAGASGLKLARGMRLLSPGMERWLLRMGDEAVDMAALKQVRWPTDLPAVFNRAPVAAIGAAATDLWRVAEATDPKTALRLLPHIDDANDARRMARASAALGPRTLGSIEVLGKARMMRLGIRLSDLAQELFAGLAGMVAAAISFAKSLGLRLLRGGMRRLA